MYGDGKYSPDIVGVIHFFACVVTGDRANGGSTDTNLTVLKAYVVAMDTDMNFNNPAKGTGCGELAQSGFGTLYSEIADVCM